MLRGRAVATALVVGAALLLPAREGAVRLSSIVATTKLNFPAVTQCVCPQLAHAADVNSFFISLQNFQTELLPVDEEKQT